MVGEPEKCPRCRKPIKKGVQKTLDGKEIHFKFCADPDCGWQEPRLELKF